MHKVAREAVTSLHDLSAVDLIAGYRTKQFSPSEVLEDVLTHVAAWEPHIKALYLFDPDGARAVRIEQIERLDVRLPRRDMLNHFLQHFRGRELLGTIAGDQVRGGKVMQRGDFFFGGWFMHANLPANGFR